MRSSSIIVFVVTKLFLLSLAGAVSRGPNKLQREVPDAFKLGEFDSICLAQYWWTWTIAQTFEAFPHPIGVMDIDNDKILDCLSARRAEMDPKAQTATYVWSLAGSDGKTRSHVPVYHMPGDSPDATRYSVGSKDGPVEVGYFRYTDYKHCAILEMPHFGDQCTLWVSEEVRDSIPAECLEQYADICGEGAPIYDKEMCKDADK